MHNSEGAGVDVLTGAVTAIANPAGGRIANALQSNHPYIGIDTAALYYFNAVQASWETLFKAPSGTALDQYSDLEIRQGLIPFITRQTDTGIQDIWFYDLTTGQSRQPTGFSQWKMQHPCRLFSQPKVFVKNTDTLMVTLVQFDTNSVKDLLIYSLLHQNAVSQLPLSAAHYDGSFSMGDLIAISSTTSLYSQNLIVFDPFAAKEIWRENALMWMPYGEDLMSVSDFFFGFQGRIDPATGRVLYTLPSDVNTTYPSSLLGENYCFTGRMTQTTSGPRDHLVMVNRENGCEVFRQALPFSMPNYADPVLLCYPESSLMLVLDNDWKLHFLKLKE